MVTLDERVKFYEGAKVSRRNFIRSSGAVIAAGLAPLISFASVEAEELKEQQKSNPMPRNNNTSLDSVLEPRMNAFIKDLGRSRHLNPTDELSITVYDIDHGRKFVSINEDVRRMAASTIKDYVMLAVFHEVSLGNLKYTSKVKGLVESMISYNRGLAEGNHSANVLIDMLGSTQRVNQILRGNYKFFNETRIVEHIPTNARTYRNTTSTHDLSIFYNQLWKGSLPYSSEMKRILSLPKHDRLFDGTCIPSGTRVLNKTGTVYGLVADSGILVMKEDKGKTHPYIITVIIEDKTKPHSRDRKEAGRWIKYRSDLIRELSEGAYDFLYQLHTGKPYYCNKHQGRHLGGHQ